MRTDQAAAASWVLHRRVRSEGALFLGSPFEQEAIGQDCRGDVVDVLGRHAAGEEASRQCRTTCARSRAVLTRRGPRLEAQLESHWAG